jgi:V8-like Glu-specific endopeptidase
LFEREGVLVKRPNWFIQLVSMVGIFMISLVGLAQVDDCPQMQQSAVLIKPLDAEGGIPPESQMGSGVIISPNGYILTAFHVTSNNDGEPYEKFYIYTSCGLSEPNHKYNAYFYRTTEDPNVFGQDLALLEIKEDDEGQTIETRDFVYLPPSYTKHLVPEDTVTAWGYPQSVGFNFGHVAGIISSGNTKVIYVRVEQGNNYGHGMSGGPVTDKGKNLIGIVARGGDGVRPYFIRLEQAESLFEGLQIRFSTVVPPSNAEQYRIVITIRVHGVKDVEVSSTFRHAIGNDNSCTEEEVRREFVETIDGFTTITSYEGPQYHTQNNNGQAWVEMHKPNMQSVTAVYFYSDRGRDFVGNCRGNGWVDASFTIYGLKAEEFVDILENSEVVGAGIPASISLNYPIEKLAGVRDLSWTYEIRIDSIKGGLTTSSLTLNNNSPASGKFSSQISETGQLTLNIK